MNLPLDDITSMNTSFIGIENVCLGMVDLALLCYTMLHCAKLCLFFTHKRESVILLNMLSGLAMMRWSKSPALAHESAAWAVGIAFIYGLVVIVVGNLCLTLLHVALLCFDRLW